MAHQAARIADIVGDIDELQRIQHGKGGRPVADVESEDRAERLHLTGCEGMARVTFEPRMAHLAHPPLDRLPELQRILALPVGTQVQRFQSFQHNPGVEGGKRRPGVALERHERLGNPFFRTADRPGQHPALSVHQLGRRIRHDIRAELHRALQHAGGEGVVHHADDPARAGEAADMFEVHHVECRIGRRFEEEHLCFGANGGFPGIVVRAVDRGRGNAELGQQHVRQPAARAERGACGDDVIARLQLAQQCRGHRGHPARLRAAALRPLH